MKVIYMGTPEYSARILNDIINTDIEVVAVFTQPDKKQGRNNKIISSPVKKLAESKNIPVYQPNKFDDETINQIKNIDCDYIIVAIYGQLIPKEVLDYKSCLNIHTSLLPKYRGASPIQQSILNEDKETGVSIILMDEGLDTGPVISSVATRIFENEMAYELFDRLTEISGKLIIDTIKNYKRLEHTVQKGKSQYCKKIRKEDGLLDLQNAKDTILKYRAYEPWPGVYLSNGLKIKKIEIEELSTINEKEGIILKIYKDYCIVSCKIGSLKVYKVQAPSKKEVNMIDYINGQRLNVYDSII